MRLAIVFCLAVFSLGLQRAAAQQGGHQHRRSTEQWLRSLERPERAAWQKPDEVVRALGLNAGDHVADIGAGTGYFSVRFAKAVGAEGRVFAVDIDEGLIEHLEKRAAAEGLGNLKAVQATPDDPKLPASSVDVVFICNVIHHIENRADYYAKLSRALKPGGRIVIVDFYKRELPVGPGVAMKISKPDMAAELTAAGFAAAEEFDFLPHQYFLVFEKP